MVSCIGVGLKWLCGRSGGSGGVLGVCVWCGLCLGVWCDVLCDVLCGCLVVCLGLGVLWCNCGSVVLSVGLWWCGLVVWCIGGCLVVILAYEKRC